MKNYLRKCFPRTRGDSESDIPHQNEESRAKRGERVFVILLYILDHRQS
jgi:hypothetical protein